MSIPKVDSLCFQDVLGRFTSKHNNEDIDDDDDEANVVANAFFELANAPMVSYRISASCEIHIQQDVSACGHHTGGIVWETSYLLLNFLRATNISENACCNRLLEVGAGCGLVGLGCHKSGSRLIAKEVIITETHDVMPNLLDNWKRNYPCQKDDRRSSSETSTLQLCELDWNNYRDDCKKANIKKHSIDIIVGTDVVFAVGLVEPLIKTMRYLAHEKTIAYLCLQERCKDSHELLLEKAREHDFHIQDISDEYAAIPECQWGKDLECCLLKFTVVTNKQQRKKKRKRSKQTD
eukprot:scaffold20461_cov117-Cylindrotheca_fusiformis.AAC.3